jgi:hypothetical protein
MNANRRAVLQSIAFGADARIAPRDRLAALERLKEFDQTFHDVDRLTEEEVLAELDSFYSSMLALVFIGSPDLEPDVKKFPATCQALRNVVGRTVKLMLANGASTTRWIVQAHSSDALGVSCSGAASEIGSSPPLRTAHLMSTWLTRWSSSRSGFIWCPYGGEKASASRCSTSPTPRTGTWSASSSRMTARRSAATALMTARSNSGRILHADTPRRGDAWSIMTARFRARVVRVRGSRRRRR